MDLVSAAKVVKSYSTGKFEIALFELDTGEYVIGHLTKFEADEGGNPHLSEKLTDFRTAAFLFDLKLKELEGN